MNKLLNPRPTVKLGGIFPSPLVLLYSHTDLLHLHAIQIQLKAIKYNILLK
jgi:hypothetical protein